MTCETALPAAFIFDCDGTLLLSMDVWLRTQPALLARHGIQATADDFAEFEHLSVEEECEGYHRKWGVGASGEELLRELMEILEHEYRENISARPGALAFLEEAHAAGIPMAIATSTPEHLVRAGLRHNGMEQFFDVVVTTAEAGRSKQFPDVYNLALERLCAARGMELPPHDAVWVFEDAEFGLRSARGAGYRLLGIFDPDGRGAADTVRALSDIYIESYTDLALDDIVRYQTGE